MKEEAILGEGKLADVAGSEQAGLIGYATQIGIRLLDSQTLAQISFTSRVPSRSQRLFFHRMASYWLQAMKAD